MPNYRGARVERSLAQAASLALRLEEGKDIVLTDGALDVADDATRGVVHELNSDLDNTTTRASAAENLCHLSLVCSRVAAAPHGTHGAPLE